MRPYWNEVETESNRTDVLIKKQMKAESALIVSKLGNTKDCQKIIRS